jgi:hypothetical protein
MTMYRRYFDRPPSARGGKGGRGGFDPGPNPSIRCLSKSWTVFASVSGIVKIASSIGSFTLSVSRRISSRLEVDKELPFSLVSTTRGDYYKAPVCRRQLMMSSDLG